MTAILYTLLYIACGCAVVRCMLPRRCPVTRVWLGASLGMLLLMVLPAGGFLVFGLMLAAINIITGKFTAKKATVADETEEEV